MIPTLRRWMTLACLMGIVAGVHSEPSDTISLSTVRSWFEWGEYGKIIRDVPDLIGSATLDSAQRATLHLFLGVAYFDQGKIAAARSEYVAALELNDLIELDKNYASREMLELFELSREEFLAEKYRKAVQDSLLFEQQAQLQRREAELREIDLSRRIRRQRVAWTLSGMGSNALAVGLFGAAIFNYLQAEESDDLYREAAQRGDYQDHRKYDRLRRSYDAAYAGYGAGAILATGLSTWIFLKLAAISTDKSTRLYEIRPGNAGLALVVYY